MKFEKKVIIGSITSFITAAVGFIAIFFPDLFNLQKEKIETLKIDIVDEIDRKDLQDFLLKKIKSEKIFNLDILYLDTSHELNSKKDKRSYLIDNNNPPEPYIPEKNVSLYVLDDNDNMLWVEEEGAKKPWWESIYGNVFEGYNYTFDGNLYWCDDYGAYRKPQKEKFKDICGVRIKGTFYYDENNSNPEYGLYHFKRVSEEQLKMKDY